MEYAHKKTTSDDIIKQTGALQGYKRLGIDNHEETHFWRGHIEVSDSSIQMSRENN